MNTANLNPPLVEAKPSSRMEARELASELNINIQSVYRGLRAGTIPSIRLGKRFIIPRAAISDWLRDCNRGPVR
jgi:excisionase family DNA binding protein